MKTNIHVVLDHDDRDSLYEWAKLGDRNVSQQMGRLIRQERARLETEKRGGGRTSAPPVKITESVES
jgi:hypothetical protein